MTRLGPYEVLELLGRGGMGEVYRARDPRLGRDVAVKVLPADLAGDPHRLRRFEREARAVAALNHPNVLSVFDVGSQDGTPYLVTELLEGQTLRERLLSGPLPSRQALGWALDIARGLEAAHAHAIVHRDLKPSNVFVTTDGRVKILDFGLARARRELSADDSSPTTGATSQGSPAGMVAGTLAYMSPEQLRGAPLDGRSDLFALGVVLYEMVAGVHPFQRESSAEVISAILDAPPPALDTRAPGTRGPLAGVIERCLEKRVSDRFDSAHDLAVALEALLERPRSTRDAAAASEPSPYPGLAAFTERDAGVFFGREREVAALWEKLHDRRLLAVIGPSGAGKSSFVRAGVVASCPPGWAALVATPGRSPVRALTQALVPEFAGDPETLRGLVAVEEPGDLLEVAARWRRGHDEVLLVVDQLEELFTLNPPATQAQVADLLGRLATEAEVHVVLVLRDDFLLRTQEQPALRPVLHELTALLPMSGDELRRAVVEPARKHGYRFEDDALVEELAGAVEGERGALPLLAFAMARLWDERDRERRLLTRESHLAIGGVAGALARHAETTLERVGPERQGLVREIFRHLVTAQGTRAVADRAELLSALADRSEAEEVLGQLVSARLLTSYEPDSSEETHAHHRIEIVHESLLRSWPRLVRWQAQDADGAVLRDQLRQAAHLWEEKGRSRDLLWSGTAYREFELWRERYPGTLTSLEQAYAGAMVERARRRKRGMRLAVAAAFALLAGVAAAIAVSREQTAAARDEARAEANKAEASRVLALAQLRLEDDPTEALALATASLELADSPGSRRFVTRVLWEAPPALELAGVGGGARVPTFSPDGRWLATAGHAPEAHVFGEGGERIAVLPGHEGTPRGPNRARWGGGRVLVTGLALAEQLHVWSLPDGHRIRTLDLGAASRWEVGGKDLLVETPEAASGRRAPRLRSWRLPDGDPQPVGRLDGATPAASIGRFSPNARHWLEVRGRAVLLRGLPLKPGDAGVELTRHASDVTELAVPLGNGEPLYSRDAGGELRLYHFDPPSPPRVEVVPRKQTAPEHIYPEPSGRWLVNDPWEENHARVWDRSAWPQSRPLVLRRSTIWYGAVAAFHPSGDWLVVSTANFTNLTFWPLTKRRPSVVDGYAGLARSLAFSPDGRWLATTWADGELRLWPLGDGAARDVRRLELPGLRGPSGLRFDPRGRSLFVVTANGGAQIVDLDGSRSRSLVGFPSDVMLYALAWSPSGRRVAAASGWGQSDRSLQTWDLETGGVQTLALPGGAVTQGGPEPEPDLDDLPGLYRSVQSLGFTDETTLLSAGDGGVRRWDLTTGEQRLLFPAPPGHYSKMALAPDGRTAVVRSWPFANATACRPLDLVDLESGHSRALPQFGECTEWDGMALDPTGRVLATSDQKGMVRVGYLTADEPHLLAGHKGSVSSVALSPDLRWVASAGEDNTLRLWPMPDLDAPPLHTLPREELIAKLKSLTNFRAVRDPEAPDGWRIDLAPFPGWKEIPTW